MKVCIVGSGNQGTGMAGLLAQEPDIEELILVDCDIERAEKAKMLVESLKDRCKVKRIKTLEGDAANIAQMTEYAKGCDLIFNALFASFNYPLMKTALAVGAHYVDLRSNVAEGPGITYKETIDAQLEMDDEFKAAGLTACPCLGLSPGYSNLVANHMIEEMDEVDTVIFRLIDWMDSTVLISPILPRNMFYLWLGPPHPTRIVNGRMEKIGLVESMEEFEFPAPAGKHKIYTFTQDPDIALVSKFANKPIPYIEAKMGCTSGGLEMNDLWLKAISEQTCCHDSSDDMFDLFGKSLIYNTNFYELYEQGLLKEGMLASSIEVTGKKDGVTMRRTITCASTMSEAMKHIPWAAHNVYGTIGGLTISMVLMLCRKEFTRRGVITAAHLQAEKELIDKKIIERGGTMLNEKIEKGNYLT